MRKTMYAVLAIALALTIPTQAPAAWAPEGTMLDDGAYGYLAGRIHADGSGGHVVWLQAHWNSIIYGVFGRVGVTGDHDPAWDAAEPGRPGLAAPDGAGGFFTLATMAPSGGGSYQCIVRHLKSDGTPSPTWPDPGVPLSDYVFAPWTGQPQLLADGAGGVYVSYEYDQPTVASGVDVQHFSALGLVAPGWPSAGRRIAITPAPAERSQPLVSDGAGGVFVLAVTHSGSSRVITAHHLLGTGEFDPNWTSSGIELTATAFDPGQVRLVEHPGGEASAVWQTSDAGARQLNVLRFNALLDQGELWTASAPMGTATRWMGAFDDGQSGLTVLWQQTAPASDVRGLRWNAAGTVAPGWADPGASRLPAAAVLDSAHDIAADRAGTGGALIAWKDLRDGQDQMFMTRLLDNGTRHGDWSADGDKVPIAAGLHPTAPGATGYPLDVEFGADGHAYVAWHVGDINYDDARLARLVVGPPAGVGAHGTVALAAPRVSPSPARGRLHATFAYPGGGPARLELLDLSGRRVRAESVAGSAGERQIHWTLGDDVPPGLYFLRLVHQGIAATRRFSVVR